MFRMLSLGCLILGVSIVSLARTPGDVVSASESKGLLGGTCYRQTYSLFWNMNCYGGTCSSGGCGCTHNYLDTDMYGHTPNAATPCGTSWQCTAMTTVSTTTCSGGGGGTFVAVDETILP